MKMSEGQEKGKKKVNEATTFPVAFALGEKKENIVINTNPASKSSKEQIINQALKFHSQGKIQEAAELYQYFINQGFNDHRVFSNYGIILKNLGKLKEAELSQRKAIEVNPDYANAHYNLGNILGYRGKAEEAASSYRKAIELNPDFINAHCNLGNTLKNLGELKEAELSTRKAIKLNPNLEEAHYNLGNVLRDLGNLEQAELSTRKAIELNPNFADAYSNLGGILRDLGNLEQAELSTRKAIELNPDFAIAHSNLGNVLRDIGNLQEAENSYRKAIELNPDFADAHSNLSHLELLKGDYQSGLENYEFRLNKKQPTIPKGTIRIKRVNNEKLQKGEKLLIVSEQGLGDTLQYMRYIPYLRNKGLNVSFCAQEKLHTLIQASGIDQNPLPPEQSILFSEGKWIPLLSLPRYLKLTPKNPIITEPYIFSNDELRDKWKNILSQEKRPIIGINWQGNKNIENFYQGRSIPLETFSILSSIKNITMLSLQKGFGSEQLDSCSFRNKFVQCQPQIDSTWDFLENAAIIENCDLIITCDTSIAHLAGGMGKTVWLLLRDIPFWTWGLERDTTFWYPTMKLFRQKERHNWNEVMERVSNQLKLNF